MNPMCLKSMKEFKTMVQNVYKNSIMYFVDKFDDIYQVI